MIITSLINLPPLQLSQTLFSSTPVLPQLECSRNYSSNFPLINLIEPNSFTSYIHFIHFLFPFSHSLSYLTRVTPTHTHTPTFSLTDTFPTPNTSTASSLTHPHTYIYTYSFLSHPSLLPLPDTSPWQQPLHTSTNYPHDSPFY